MEKPRPGTRPHKRESPRRRPPARMSRSRDAMAGRRLWGAGVFAFRVGPRASRERARFRLRVLRRPDLLATSQTPASHNACNALTNLLAFLSDHCSRPGPNRSICPFSTTEVDPDNDGLTTPAIVPAGAARPCRSRRAVVHWGDRSPCHLESLEPIWQAWREENG